MECTQRLEYTQELYEPKTEKVCPEQIGFLGICGAKHPVIKGPNKIGRDPQTCNIVLNLNSVSRQHAVINVLNHKVFMLMDLDSANKTKLMDKTLSPYIPHPLKNGDLVQFGDVFGVFRLIEDDDDLPMTQAIDIPETPIPTRHLSKLNKFPNTTVPESPDVSDRDDSFIAPSQPKEEKCFRNSNSHFVKPSSNVISIQPVGTNKIDNVYWSSAKRSVSLNSQLNESHDEFDKSNKNINGSIYEMATQNPFLNDNPVDENCGNCVNIHDADTQAPYTDEKAVVKKDNFNNIHDIETQIPYLNEKSPKKSNNDIHEMETQAFIVNQANDSTASVYSANTQLPHSPTIHSLATQMPLTSREHLPEVHKIDNQQEMQINLFATTKGNEIDDDIFTADTQPLPVQKEILNHEIDILNISKDSNVTKLHTSDEEIVLEEMDSGNCYDNLESQPLLPLAYLQENFNSDNDKVMPMLNEIPEKVVTKIEIKQMENHSDSSTDCEDILLLSQKEKDDDLTDCEDILEENQKNLIGRKCENLRVSNVHFEDMLTQRIDDNIEDLPTQVITLDNEKEKNANLIREECFEDLPTQVIDEESTNVLSASSNVNPSDLESPFKIPLISPIKFKRKDLKSNLVKDKVILNKVAPVEDDNYYAATQDILEDLCSQQNKIAKSPRDTNESDDELVPCSVEDYKTGNKFPHLEINVSPTKTNKSSDNTDNDDDKIDNFVSNLTSQQILDVIGVDSQVEKLKKAPSDLSDIDVTPKKVRNVKFMDIDLPNSQEIKTVVSLHSKTPITESSSESESEIDSQEQCTPILFRKRRKPKNNAKIDLTNKFDLATLPTRIITRVRKPTSKSQINDELAMKLTNNILKPKFLTEQEEEIDKDIITENISRLKGKSEKSKQRTNQSGNKSNISKIDKIVEKENEKKTDKDLIIDNISTVKSKSENPKQKDNQSGKRPNTLKDDKRVEKENEKKPDKVVVKVEIHNDKSKNSKNSKESVKAKNISNNTSKSDTSAVELKNDNLLKQESKQKLNNEIPITKGKSSKDIEGNLCKNTSPETNVSRKITRSTRSKRLVDAVMNKSQVEEKTQLTRKEKSNRQRQTKKPIVNDLTEEITEVRRSKRQRPSKEKKDEEAVKIKSILKKDNPVKHEQSTIYSLSSESDSPVNSKRSATSELRPPSPKRTRSNAANISAINYTSLRSTPARVHRTQNVLFTAFPSEEVRAKLEKLGAVIVSDVSACTMVLTLQIKRTFKLLCAVGLGKPIVGPSWVQACVDSNIIVDPWLYVLKDEAAEKRFQFNLERVLQGKRNFLKGYNLSSTPNVLPNQGEMKFIVECSGGVWKEGGTQWICVSCVADKALWPSLKKRGATVVTTEFILGGVLRQKVDIEANKL